MNDIENFFLESFKQCFLQKLEKSIEIEFDTILSFVCFENSIERDNITNLNTLQTWFNDVYHGNYLKNILSSDDLEELIIHNIENIDFITMKGREKLKVEFLSLTDFKLSLKILTKRANKEWNFKRPFLSYTQRIDGSEFRITLIHDSITKSDCPKVFLRKLNRKNINLAAYGLEEEQQEIMISFVTNKSNLLIAGATGSGKTTFLNTLLDHVNSNEHIVVIEDTQEIQGPEDRFTHLLSSEVSGKTMKDFCKYSLRMSPDRILLGEIRSDEIIPFILAMNTGHRGMMSTIHANSAKDTLLRMAMLFCTFSTSAGAISYKQVLKLICENIDHVVFLENKRVKEVIEVIGCESESPIFRILYQREGLQGNVCNLRSAAS